MHYQTLFNFWSWIYPKYFYGAFDIKSGNRVVTSLAYMIFAILLNPKYPLSSLFLINLRTELSSIYLSSSARVWICSTASVNYVLSFKYYLLLPNFPCYFKISL